jgi:hypothetical protein
LYETGTTGISSDESILPRSDLLNQNFPNPFNPETLIGYQLSNDGFVTIKVYDVLGREIKTLVNEFKNKGIYRVIFDGSNLSSGVYYYQFKTNNFVSTKKMLLLK